MADQKHLLAGLNCADRKGVMSDIWADLALREHMPVLREFLSKSTPPDWAAIERANKFIAKRARLEDIVERRSWENMSVASMERRITELKRDVAAIDQEYFGGRREGLASQEWGRGG